MNRDSYKLADVIELLNQTQMMIQNELTPVAVFELERSIDRHLDLLKRQIPPEDHMTTIARYDADRIAVAELLATIHRDGGHHTNKVGIHRSCWDAQERYLALVVETETFRTLRSPGKTKLLNRQLGISGLTKSLQSTARQSQLIAAELEILDMIKDCESFDQARRVVDGLRNLRAVCSAADKAEEASFTRDDAAPSSNGGEHGID